MDVLNNENIIIEQPRSEPTLFSEMPTYNIDNKSKKVFKKNAKSISIDSRPELQEYMNRNKCIS